MFIFSKSNTCNCISAYCYMSVGNQLNRENKRMSYFMNINLASLDFIRARVITD